MADTTADPERAAALREPAAGEKRAPRTVPDDSRGLPAPEDTPTPAYGSAHGIVTSIRRRAVTHERCNTTAVAVATFARRFWPTSNRSRPARDASAPVRYACYDGDGARASA